MNVKCTGDTKCIAILYSNRIHKRNRHFFPTNTQPRGSLIFPQKVSQSGSSMVQNCQEAQLYPKKGLGPHGHKFWHFKPDHPEESSVDTSVKTQSFGH